jgi:hypothetical protein
VGAAGTIAAILRLGQPPHRGLHTRAPLLGKRNYGNFDSPTRFHIPAPLHEDGDGGTVNAVTTPTKPAGEVEQHLETFDKIFNSEASAQAVVRSEEGKAVALGLAEVVTAPGSVIDPEAGSRALGKILASTAPDDSSVIEVMAAAGENAIALGRNVESDVKKLPRGFVKQLALTVVGTAVGVCVGIHCYKKLTAGETSPVLPGERIEQPVAQFIVEKTIGPFHKWAIVKFSGELPPVTPPK